MKITHVRGANGHRQRNARSRSERPRGFSLREKAIRNSSRFHFDSQAVGDAVGECKVGDDRTQVMDGAVIEPVVAQGFYVLRIDRRGFVGQLCGIVGNCPVCFRKWCTLKIVFECRRELFRSFRSHARFFQVATQTAPMMNGSVMALVNRRNNSRHHFSLDKTQRPVAPHQFGIQLIVKLHAGAVDGVDLNDVVIVINAIACGNFVGIAVRDIGHVRIWWSYVDGR